MANTLEQFRNTILTAIHGRRCGIDAKENLVGPKAFVRGVTAATSDTTGTELPNHGYISLVTSTNDTWTLDEPYDGAEVTLMTGSSSTGTHAVTVAPAVIYSTNGIAGAQFNLAGAGAAITARGISTSVWVVTSRSGSSPSNWVSS